MEIRLFGKSLFSVGKSRADYILQEARSSNDESKSLPDFYQAGNTLDTLREFVEVTESQVFTTSSASTTVGTVTGVNVARLDDKPNAPEEKKEEQEKLTPKKVYELQMLNDKAFELNVEPEYVEKQIASFKDRLQLLKSQDYDMRRGVKEVSSVLMRMENRRSYAEVAEFFAQFPYTMTAKIADLTKNHTYLQIGQIGQFLADLPNDAVQVMKDYSAKTKQICGKEAVFYIIADQKDFKKTNTRRDPILLAQSPFGHFWQILGAWDKEMLLVDEL